MFNFFFAILAEAATTVDETWNQYCDTLIVQPHYNNIDGRVYLYVDQERFALRSVDSPPTTCGECGTSLNLCPM